MRSKLNFLINYSFSKKIKSKWFIIANVVIAILIIGLINIDSIINLFGGDFDSKTKIYISDSTNNIGSLFSDNIKIYEETLYGNINSKYEVKISNKTEKNLKKIIENDKAEKNSIIISITEESENLVAKIISLGKIDTYDYQLISSALNTTIESYKIVTLDLNEEQLNKLSSKVEITREILDETITSEEENVNMVMTTVFPIFILPFFMLTIFLVQFIGNEVNDEKSNKSMEIIISNVSAKIHFASKIISNNLFILLQLILFIIYAAVGFFVRSNFSTGNFFDVFGSEISGAIKIVINSTLGKNLAVIIILTVILMILTFIAYSLIAGILASMTTNSEDYQQVQIPIVFTLLGGYYLSIMAGLFKGSLLIKLLSFFPFISAILSPSLLVLGQIGIAEVIISIILIIITILLLIKYGMKVYKVGILNYSQTDIWKKILKSIKEK